MLTTLFYAAVLATIIMLMFVKFSRHQARKKLKSELDSATTQITKPAFRCVSIVTGENACKSVEALKNKRILVNYAPLVPLKSCDASQCDCHYKRFDDRRTGSDRRVEEDTKHALAYADKRHVQDRRSHSIKELLTA